MSKTKIARLLISAAAFLMLGVAPVYAQYDYYDKALQLDGDGDYAELNPWSLNVTPQQSMKVGPRSISAPVKKGPAGLIPIVLKARLTMCEFGM